MEYSFKKINIEAPFPTTQCGHSSQINLIYDYHDPLYCRASSFKDDNNWIIHLSLDLLAFDLKHRNLIQDYLRNYFANNNLHLITSSTHTHYANSVRDDKYVDYLYNLLKEELIKMEYKDINDVTTSYQRIHCTAVGKSRISDYETNNEYLGLIKFYENDDNFFNLIYYNCHPTILHANVPYFSSEYPGYVLAKLEKQYPNTDFTYMQGAAGDISSRFVRSGQDYDALKELGDNLYNQIIDLMKQEVDRKPLQLEYKEVPLEYEHEFTPIDLSQIRADLSERELETIKLGQEARKKLEEKNNPLFTTLIKDIIISSLNFGSIKFIFFPNEIFSEYMNYLDLNKELLVSYSNGYGPYVLPIDFKYITYEMFTDTLTKKTKEKIIEILKTI